MKRGTGILSGSIRGVHLILILLLVNAVCLSSDTYGYGDGSRESSPGFEHGTAGIPCSYAAEESKQEVCCDSAIVTERFGQKILSSAGSKSFVAADFPAGTELSLAIQIKLKEAAVPSHAIIPIFLATKAFLI
jgi:hypothetical protein